ncbi:shikimate 5-dehydrogenase [Patiriisocius marinistellae]|uniref:Shikimate 5-dehydrogenase n=1 Tax=Patiriisocius marinistellae TaxID=2494560 RepID=A0A5J4FV74_9FLAO|nr:shikimate dehydrogenase [Patiriisocius marinistellae]GEQ85860.1 shikimate 5-dehydrogenase [Patiriisocius marinistellae]
MAKFGLVGKNISYSFSKTFFTIKFDLEKLNHTYVNFDIKNINQLQNILKDNTEIKGLNVTIPYKEDVIPYLDRIDKEAKKIGAVNTIKILNDGRLAGYNTDHYGFAKALTSFPLFKEKTALVLGSGGASKAIIYVLKAMNFDFKVVSRTPKEGQLSYKALTPEVINKYKLIINTTPLGTHPNVTECPNIPYNLITPSHFLYDLIYNPTETEFLKRGFAKGATVSNGMKMLEYQAKKSWKIWNL